MTVSTHPLRRASKTARGYPTIWGLTPPEIHDRFWLSQGVQVVRRGEVAAVAPEAEVFLLLGRSALALFDVVATLKLLRKGETTFVSLLLEDHRDLGYREFVRTDDKDRFVRVERVYHSIQARFSRVALTTDRALAEVWRTGATHASAWRQVKRSVPKSKRTIEMASGFLYDRFANTELAQFIRDVVQVWRQPEASIPGIGRQSDLVWSTDEGPMHPQARCFGPVWVGRGRRMDPWTNVIGPAVLWDEMGTSAFLAGGRRGSDSLLPAKDPSVAPLNLSELLPDYPAKQWQTAGRRSLASRTFKRGFDIVFSLVALALTLPFYPLVMLLIYLEDGRPFFFGHRREGMRGKEFTCWKFRSMRKNADEVKAMLSKQNMADGPQFFIEEDPRLTRVGRILRKMQVDEWPQFWNVFSGDMSVVGPRPSPFSENQYCPPWREARLSVRPGITGLWQVKRSRAHGLDFQEWIRYDIQYVENRSFALDLRIIWDSIWMVTALVTKKTVEKASQLPAEVVTPDPVGEAV